MLNPDEYTELAELNTNLSRLIAVIANTSGSQQMGALISALTTLAETATTYLELRIDDMNN